MSEGTTARLTDTAAYLLLQSLRSHLHHGELFAQRGESGLVCLMIGWRKGEARSRLWGKVEEKGGFKQWQQQPSRREQLLLVTNLHRCRLAQIPRAASRVRSETMPAMPATTRGVDRACMNETAIDSGSDRGRAHVHIVVHVMQARVRVLAYVHAHAYASACCARPRGWRARLSRSRHSPPRRPRPLLLVFYHHESVGFSRRKKPTPPDVL